MDFSVFSLAFVNSTRTFADASMNLKLKVLLLSAVIILLSIAMMKVTLVSLKRPLGAFAADVREELATG